MVLECETASHTGLAAILGYESLEDCRPWTRAAAQESCWAGDMTYLVMLTEKFLLSYMVLMVALVSKPRSFPGLDKSAAAVEGYRAA